MARRLSFSFTPTVALGGVVIATGGLVVAMWRMGFFTFTGTDPSAKLVASALALVGTVLGATIAVVGIVVKHSLDQQTEQRQLEAERRLSLDTAVRAIQLFSAEAGGPASEIQRDGALFTLANLGQHDLTLQLVDDLLARSEISAGTAAKLLDMVILRGDTAAARNAVSVLHGNAARMVTPKGCEFPQSIIDGTDNLSEQARYWAMHAIGEVLLARPAQEWADEFRYDLNGLLAGLAASWAQEDVPRVKRNVGCILRGVLEAFPEFGGTVPLATQDVDFGPVRSAVAASTATGGATMDIVQRLNSWGARTALPNEASL